MLADHQGSIRQIVDNGGALLNQITYDSYGNITHQTNPSVTFRFGYTGREWDGETGQYYYRARYYDARVGRFLSTDPIGFSAGDANLYRYVGNSPTNATDPSGLDGEVLFQGRTLLLSDGTRIRDAGLAQFTMERGAFLPSWRLPNSQPDLRGREIVVDQTEALIQFKSESNGPTNPRVEPWGGRYTHRGIPEHRGHIIPHNLGGSDRDRRNFFSQNPSINTGEYAQWGIQVDNYLQQLGRARERRLNRGRGSRGRSCPEPAPSVSIIVNLIRDHGRSLPGFPFRPDRFEATATFSDGAMFRGTFSNVPGVPSVPGRNYRVR
jgi:RHS repeat-associated protein